MFHVRKEEHINKTFRIPIDLLHQLEIVAQSEKVSLNNLVIQCCKYALDNMSPNDASVENDPLSLE